MAGEARSQAFMLGTATVMLGQQAGLFNMRPDTHSIGLVKNFSLSADSSYTELTQGVRNQVVFSVKTGNKIMATMEAYEFTARNLNYALGLEGYVNSLAPITTSATIVTSGVGSTTVLALSELLTTLTVTAGDFISIQIGEQDNVLVRKVTQVNVSTCTIDPPLPAAYANFVGAKVSKTRVVPIGSQREDAILAASIVGTIADGTEVSLLLPKVKVTKGFNVAFNSGDFQNLPLELTVYDQIVGDPHYNYFLALGNPSGAMFTTK